MPDFVVALIFVVFVFAPVVSASIAIGGLFPLSDEPGR
jgi:hypothetical protein